MGGHALHERQGREQPRNLVELDSERPAAETQTSCAREQRCVARSRTGGRPDEAAALRGAGARGCERGASGLATAPAASCAGRCRSYHVVWRWLNGVRARRRDGREQRVRLSVTGERA